jgi:hypothetical protein
MASEEAQIHVNALLNLVKRLEEENTSLKRRIAQLETISKPPMPPPVQSATRARSNANEDGIIRAKARDVVQKAQEVDRPNAREVVRGKRDREAMQGFQCDQCKQFYEATGIMPERCSKHKLHRPPPDTPEGFWEPWSFD